MIITKAEISVEQLPEYFRRIANMTAERAPALPVAVSHHGFGPLGILRVQGRLGGTTVIDPASKAADLVGPFDERLEIDSYRTSPRFLRYPPTSSSTGTSFRASK